MKKRRVQISIEDKLVEWVHREAHGRGLTPGQVLSMIVADWYKLPDNQFPEIPRIPNATRSRNRNA